MNKTLSVVLLLLIAFATNISAQETTSSPYSFYGIGDIKFKGAQENRAMGGVAVFKDSLHLNFQNPASYSHLAITSFSIAGSHKVTSFKETNMKDNAHRTTVDYLAVGLPMGKFGVAFGLMPYSSVGYKISNSFVNEEGLNSVDRFSGEGGVNKVFAGVGYSLSPSFSIGADLGYNFGTISTKSLEFISGVQYGSRETSETTVSGFMANFGAMYNKKLGEKYHIYASVAYSPENTLKLENESSIAIVQFISDDVESVIDIEDTRSGSKKIKNPSKFSFGLGFGEDKKFGLGTQLTLSQSNSFGNRFDDLTNADFEDGMKIGVGGFYIPKYNSFTSYFSRVVYRAGFNYEKTGMVINNQNINDYAVTFGIGLPMMGTFSNVNIGAELGSRGTTKSNLVKENYFNIMISLSLNDRWFVRSKYH